MFSKKELPADAPIEAKARPYLERKRHLSDLANAKDVGIAVYCLNTDPTLVKELDINIDNELAILKYWVNEDYSNYLSCIKYKADHIELLTMYLTQKLKRTLRPNCNDMSLIISYDKKLVINYQYETKSGETISYFDKALGVPTSLVVKANVRLKLTNARRLVEKIDVDIKYVDSDIVNNFITAILNRTVRDTVLSYIDCNSLSFYDLPQHYTAINKDIFKSLSKCFEWSGLEVVDFSVSDISVPNNMDTLLQNQFFAIAEEERLKEYEIRMENKSLDLYERKAAIHSKYPDFPISLTEAEKDFALNRYLKRMGKDTALKADIEEQELGLRNVISDGTYTTERKPTAPTFTKKSNYARIIYAISVVVLFVIAFSCFAAGVQVGLGVLACAVFISGISAFVCFEKLKYGKEIQQEIDIEQDDEEDDISDSEEEDSIYKDSSEDEEVEEEMD